MYVSSAAIPTPLVRIVRNANTNRKTPGSHPFQLIHGMMIQPTTKTWNAIVTSENARQAASCATTMSRLCSRVRSVHPIAAAPTQFGIAKMTHAQTPYSRTSSTGRNIPMTQVQEAARKVARRRSFSDEERAGGEAVNSVTGQG